MQGDDKPQRHPNTSKYSVISLRHPALISTRTIHKKKKEKGGGVCHSTAVNRHFDVHIQAVITSSECVRSLLWFSDVKNAEKVVSTLAQKLHSNSTLALGRKSRYLKTLALTPPSSLIATGERQLVALLGVNMVSPEVSKSNAVITWVPGHDAMKRRRAFASEPLWASHASSSRWQSFSSSSLADFCPRNPVATGCHSSAGPSLRPYIMRTVSLKRPMVYQMALSSTSLVLIWDFAVGRQLFTYGAI